MMIQKSSLPENLRSVSMVLTSDTPDFAECLNAPWRLLLRERVLPNFEDN
jgi:hypothetical protein